MIWVYHRMIGIPRVAAIEHPFGRPYGDVDDVETQTEVLRASLRIGESAQQAGHIEHLPMRWHEEPEQTRWHPSEPSPIIAMLKRRREEQNA